MKYRPSGERLRPRYIGFTMVERRVSLWLARSNRRSGDLGAGLVAQIVDRVATLAANPRWVTPRKTSVSWLPSRAHCQSTGSIFRLRVVEMCPVRRFESRTAAEPSYPHGGLPPAVRNFPYLVPAGRHCRVINPFPVMRPTGNVTTVGVGGEAAWRTAGCVHHVDIVASLPGRSQKRSSRHPETSAEFRRTRRSW